VDAKEIISCNGEQCAVTPHQYRLRFFTNLYFAPIGHMAATVPGIIDYICQQPGQSSRTFSQIAGAEDLIEFRSYILHCSELLFMS